MQLNHIQGPLTDFVLFTISLRVETLECLQAVDWSWLVIRLCIQCHRSGLFYPTAFVRHFRVEGERSTSAITVEVICHFHSVGAVCEQTLPITKMDVCAIMWFEFADHNNFLFPLLP